MSPERDKAEMEARAERIAVLERLACEAETKALELNAGILAEAIAEHRRQVAGFSVVPSKFGTFLKLDIQRLGNSIDKKGGWPVGPGYEQQFHTSINLKSCTGITLVRGTPADSNGTIGYHVSWGSDGDLVRADTPYVPTRRKLFHVEPKPDKHDSMMMGSGQYQPRRRTDGFARVSTDDEIRFEGTRSTLYVPFGLGEDVLSLILAAT